MVSDRAELAGERVRSAQLRVEQLRERIERLSAGVPPTQDDVAVAKACAEEQRNEALRARARLAHASATTGDLASRRTELRGRTDDPQGEPQQRQPPSSGGGPVPPELDGVPAEPSNLLGDGLRWRSSHDERSLERLRSESRVLRSALVAVAASSVGRGSGIGSVDRRRQVWQWMVDRSGEEGWRGWVPALCLAAPSLSPDLRGVAVSAYDSHQAPRVLGATDDWTRRAEEIHQMVGEGPAVMAYSSERPVVVADVAGEQARWPGFVAAAVGAGLSCVWALPVRLYGVTLGSISLYSRVPLVRGRSDRLDASLLADVAAKAVLVDLAGGEDGLQIGDPEDEKVAVATGIVSAQLGIGVDDALVRMRAFAFGNNQGLAAVAGAIMNGSLRLP